MQSKNRVLTRAIIHIDLYTFKVNVKVPTLAQLHNVSKQLDQPFVVAPSTPTIAITIAAKASAEFGLRWLLLG